MPTIKELRSELERAKTAEGFLKLEYDRLRMEADGLRAGTGKDRGKLFRTDKDTSPEKAREISGAKAALMRGAKARRAAQARYDEATLQRTAGSNGSKPVPVYGPTGARFFSDLVAATERGHNSDAAKRLQSHARRFGEARASGTVQGQGYLPPLYMADAWADVPRTAAPVFSAMPKMPLAAYGLDAYVPAWTTGAAADAQTKASGVNDDLQQADAIPVASEQVTASLVTVALDWDVNRQVLERARPGWDISFGRDTAAAVWERTDDLLINGRGTNQQPYGLLNVPSAGTLSGASASSAQAQLRLFAEAAANMYSARHALPEYAVMSPTRALSLFSGMSDTSAPLVPQGALGYGGDPERSFGQLLPGVRVLVTDKISDADVVLWRASDSIIAVDDAPLAFLYSQQGSSALRLHLISYFVFQAFLHRVPSSVMIVGDLPPVSW